ncbi:MAG TPA: hypothetical protein VF595_05950 [Tepidisphaeraceae bacterium]|jgi:hypothetical protein
MSVLNKGDFEGTAWKPAQFGVRDGGADKRGHYCVSLLIDGKTIEASVHGCYAIDALLGKGVWIFLDRDGKANGLQLMTEQEQKALDADDCLRRIKQSIATHRGNPEFCKLLVAETRDLGSS